MWRLLVLISERAFANSRQTELELVVKVGLQSRAFMASRL